MDNNVMSIMNIGGVDCYERDGVVYLRLETVARGLGFTDTKNGVEYVRWNTVRNHLADLKFSQEVAKDSFIPENIFYRLAMKAKNETAEKFQALVADEVIPTIRRTGGYNSDFSSLSPQLQLLINMERKQKEYETRLGTLESAQEVYEQRIADTVSCLAASSEPDTWRKTIAQKINSVCAKNNLDYRDTWERLYDSLNRRARCNVETRATRRKNRASEFGATATELNGITRLDCIAADPRRRETFDNIVKEFTASHILQPRI